MNLLILPKEVFMGKIRIIPCLDIKDGRVVKGVNFENLSEIGDPVKQASFYNEEKADELVLLDICATKEKRKPIFDIVRQISEKISIPIIVGGGIKNVKDIEELFNAGASKISINTSAMQNPSLIEDGAKKFGSERIVVAIDGKKTTPERWEVFIEGGKTSTDVNVVNWARVVESLGAGEILLTSMDTDGTKKGYDITMTQTVCDSVNIPVIASGGAGTLEHIHQVVTEGKASAVLLASLLHYKTLTIKEIKTFLQEKGIEISL
jgi:cyclase